jgi:hypothetical protein
MRMTAMLWRLAAAALALWALPTAAQQATPLAPSLANQPLVLDLPPSADSGKPRYFAPRDLPPSPGCTAVLDCRERPGMIALIGSLMARPRRSCYGLTLVFRMPPAWPAIAAFADGFAIAEGWPSG